MHTPLLSIYFFLQKLEKEESESHLLKQIWLWSNQASTEQAKHDHSVGPKPRGGNRGTAEPDQGLV